MALSSAMTIFIFAIYTHSVLPVDSKLQGPITGTITSTHKLSGEKWTGFIETEQNEKIYISYKVPSEESFTRMKAQVWTGMIVELHVSPVPVRLQSHAFEFSFQDYLMSKGASGAYQSSKWREIGPDDRWMWRLERLVASYRKNVHQNIVEKVPVSLHDEFLSLSIGDRSLTDQDNARLYQRLGLSHLFAISGLHIGLMTGGLYFLLLHLNVRLFTIHWILLITVPSYMLLAGAAPSVVRASLMVMIIVAFQRFQMKTDPSDLLSWVFIGTLVWSPFYFLQPGYQLSFAAVFSLIYSSRFLSRQSFVRGLFATTLICQVAVLPIVLFHFQQISIISLIVNLIAIPLFTFLLLPISLFYSVYAQLPFHTLLGINKYAVLREKIQQLFEWFASWPLSVWTPPTIEGVLPLVLLFILVSFVLAEISLWKGITVFLATAMFWSSLPHTYPDARVTFLYVGQGDSTLIELPYRKYTILIDSGGVTRFEKEDWKQGKEYEVGTSIVAPYLRAQGISTIDLFILTHADADHTEGADEILKQFSVRQLVIPKGVIHLPEMQDVLQLAEKNKVAVIELEDSITVSSKQAHFFVGAISNSYLGNDSSLLTILDVYSQKFVFAGDLEVDGEKIALKRYTDLLKNTDILKLGHHGSKTSSNPVWLDHLTPSFAIGSAGQENRYGHPHKEVLAALHERGIDYAGTHEYGTIQISVDRKGNVTLIEK
ncbi:DNA internalization-related competence protein ComEC/Rec2 [Chryseomicrobium palamuruense]|uniref:DNA internalization-related competence protein ComEC/Rec2 n=1 Tax=Chryseomicrobium palamuruense TaxID=682973 RepID=UPI00366CF587